ncbi:TetR/AcrR family transcriptional regulator [Mycobacterium sp. shizuoka-1]|uniref:TetR/AcrR family transcriptional regulator n=1 Tax=Mycobacterium sp. shizuoka-1 TaxID=2039281 RepID=UPI000C05DD54|nr:TetR/AcrR family transcriptional regulator [Mycobacterium sp. shizuoka-1]GAY18453.1 TetR family transcriptional regulator [Mycobacterium sp. shizuoka-1]
MRSRGWAGATPASDEEAIARVLDAVDDVVSEHGAALRVADVARRLGVTRQTVYRYFPNADALLMASSMRAVNGFLDQVVQHVSGLTDPVTAVVESVSFGIDNLAGDPQLENLLTVTSLTSDTAVTFCLSVFQRYDVDWELHGFDSAALRELVEMTLRTVQSLLTDPGQPRREGVELRRFLARWLGPAILYPRLTAVANYQRALEVDRGGFGASGPAALVVADHDRV